jgi:hypothetical protein
MIHASMSMIHVTVIHIIMIHIIMIHLTVVHLIVVRDLQSLLTCSDSDSSSNVLQQKKTFMSKPVLPHVNISPNLCT